MIAEADQGGLGLPDRDYYLKDDAKSVEMRKQYVAHVQKMFELLGDPAEKAAAEAKIGDGHRDLAGQRVRSTAPAA